jgi:hypothetical protein
MTELKARLKGGSAQMQCKLGYQKVDPIARLFAALRARTTHTVG